LTTHARESPVYPGFDLKFMLNVGEVEFTYIPNAILEVVDYMSR